MTTPAETFRERLGRIAADIELGMNCTLLVEQDGLTTRYYFQIACLRPDAFTGKLEMGYGGKAYLSEYASDNELIQTAFGLYKGYWEHEARETFKWRDRRVFGPHISTEALWEVARRVDVRKPIPAFTETPEQRRARRQVAADSGGLLGADEPWNDPKPVRGTNMYGMGSARYATREDALANGHRYTTDDPRTREQYDADEAAKASR